MKEKACKDCHMISLGNICPNCKSTNLSNDWTGLIILLDVENSEIAKKINAKSLGKYAIRVRWNRNFRIFHSKFMTYIVCILIRYIILQRFRLTEELRHKLKQPLGKLIKGNEEITLESLKKIVEKINPKLIISVGDIVSRSILKIPVLVNVRIIDNRAMRKNLEFFDFKNKKTFHAHNPAGSIEIMAWQAIKEAIKSEDALVIIDGEEDLLALVAVIESPNNSLVIYGQPKEGIVVIKVDETTKREAKEIIDSMILE